MLATHRRSRYDEHWHTLATPIQSPKRTFGVAEPQHLFAQQLFSCGAVQDIADRFEGQNVLIVSHGEVRVAGTVRAICCC